MADPRDEELARLRERPDNVHLLGGFGPLLVGAVLFVLMVLLAPTIAPEQVVEQPVNGEPTTTLEAITTTTAGAPASSIPVTVP
ncbi:MAG TPA: hypothetical protein VJ804_12420 [Acidimicrobiales bacterium]|nr:hypothetical protein [Acidimicrobiales bacterium]